MASVDRVLFAVKANPPPLLAHLAQLGLGFECVSMGEVERARATLTEVGAEADRTVLFTQLRARRRVRRGLRRRSAGHPRQPPPPRALGGAAGRPGGLPPGGPGQGHGHTPTSERPGPVEFGIPLGLDRAADLARAHGVRVVGLHAHVGSGVRDPRPGRRPRSASCRPRGGASPMCPYWTWAAGWASPRSAARRRWISTASTRPCWSSRHGTRGSRCGWSRVASSWQRACCSRR